MRDGQRTDQLWTIFFKEKAGIKILIHKPCEESDENFEKLERKNLKKKKNLE